MSFGRELARGLFHLIYPGICPVCDLSVPAGEALPCAVCREALTRDSHESCPRCASTVGPFALLEGGCSICRGTPFQFAQAYRLGPYEDLLRTVILRMKQSGGESLAEHVGALWAAHAHVELSQTQAQVVIPVPLHWWRAWRRGYNQSEVLARALARSLGIVCQPRWLRRCRPTPPQTSQTPGERRHNVRGAFDVRRRADLRGKTVLLVDDVLTTGSTCHEAARALRAAGASRVIVAVLAKSVL